MTRWREPLADLQARVASITFLAERSEHPGRWAALDRAGRLHRACLAQPDRRARPPLVALIGGTNTGKSTLYNLLLGERIALPCGTAIGTKAIALSVPETTAGLFEDASFLPDFEHLDWRTPEALNEPGEPDRPRLYLHRRAAGPAVALADTPDIDSLERSNHRAAEALFFAAEAIIFVASDQKYADEACLRLQRAAPRFRKAVMVVCNRTAPDSEAFADLVANKLPQAGLAGVPALALPVLPAAALQPAEPPPAPIAELRAWLDRLGHEAGLAERALAGAAVGYGDAVEVILERLGREVEAVESFAARIIAAAEREAIGYQPQSDLDDLDQAVLEALEALRVPGIDWAYEQLGLVRGKLRGGLGKLWHGLRRNLGGEPRTLEDVQAAATAREQAAVRSRLENLLAELRAEVVQTPGEVRAALLARLPAVDRPAERDAALTAYASRLAARRRELIDQARQSIMTQLEEQGVVIKLFKGATRTALMAVSVTAIVQSGGITPEELVLVPATDAITKWLLDRYLGRNWRDKLQHELSQRRRELLVGWLLETVLEPLRDALPACCREEFRTAAHVDLARLRAAVGDEGEG